MSHIPGWPVLNKPKRRRRRCNAAAATTAHIKPLNVCDLPSEIVCHIVSFVPFTSTKVRYESLPESERPWLNNWLSVVLTNRFFYQCGLSEFDPRDFAQGTISFMLDGLPDGRRTSKDKCIQWLKALSKFRAVGTEGLRELVFGNDGYCLFFGDEKLDPQRASTLVDEALKRKWAEGVRHLLVDKKATIPTHDQLYYALVRCTGRFGICDHMIDAIRVNDGLSEEWLRGALTMLSDFHVIRKWNISGNKMRSNMCEESAGIVMMGYLHVKDRLKKLEAKRMALVDPTVQKI